MSWKSPKLYEFYIKGINALSKEIDFIGWEECLDFQYLESKKLCICCIKSEGTFCDIFTLNLQDYTTINTAIKVRIREEVLKIIKSQGDNLYLKTAMKEVSIYFDVDTKMRGKILRVRGFDGDEIADFVPVGMNRLFVAMLDGSLGYHEFSEKEAVFGKISHSFKLDLLKRERCNCVAVCPYGRYAAVSTVMTTYGKDLLSKLFFLEINENNDMDILEIIDYSAADFSTEDGSYFSSISLDFYHGDFPLVFAIQHNGRNMLFSYTFRGSLNEYNEHYELHNSPCLNLKFSKNVLTSVDENGVISKVKFVKRDPKKISKFSLTPIEDDLRNSILSGDSSIRPAKKKERSRASLKSIKGSNSKRKKEINVKKSNKKRTLERKNSHRSMLSKSVGNVKGLKDKKFNFEENPGIDDDELNFKKKDPITLKSAEGRDLYRNEKKIEDEDF